MAALFLHLFLCWIQGAKKKISYCRFTSCKSSVGYDSFKTIVKIKNRTLKNKVLAMVTQKRKQKWHFKKRRLKSGWTQYDWDTLRYTVFYMLYISINLKINRLYKARNKFGGVYVNKPSSCSHWTNPKNWSQSFLLGKTCTPMEPLHNVCS